MTAAGPGQFRNTLLRWVGALLSERLTPSEAAAAVSVGIALGIIPVYGAQSIIALALASALRLNRPLTLAATFINNPLLQPFLVLGSIEVGHVALHGHWMPLTAAGLTTGDWKAHLAAFVLGSFVLAAILAPACGAFTYLAFSWRAKRRTPGRPTAWTSDQPAATEGRALELRRRFRDEVRRRYMDAPLNDRAFVWWKVRLDRIFDVLLREDLGSGLAVDLGCGYGLALLAANVVQPGRPLSGCDLDARRISAAQQALSGPGCRLSVADMVAFDIGQAQLLLIIDVLQFLDRDAQKALLSRCSEALTPGGSLIFRVPETRRGGKTLMTRWLDLAVFELAGSRVRPTHLPAADYRRWLEDRDLAVRELHLGNRLPLSHVLFVAKKPEERADA
jgi:uncharacterized protein (DUF2062 family)/SAM-dependent methyltransferase